MLRLERMEISGFKSFSDKTEVRFPDGITAVVGPNGCGKSNIGDAINWVLGEQSAKQLRGKQMADVIFAGSEARKPVGMAEVSLHLGGGEGIEGAEDGKVRVTRRLFRSGESEYLVNGKRARLKDVKELLERAHVGARTYATIEQGRIDEILNAKPTDRRLIIEDAAGIAGYKHKRRLTELKLEATHANLLRVNDIVVEVERQIRSLKRQAGKARRYAQFREALKRKEQILFGLRARELDARLAALRAAEAEARDAESSSAARLAQGEAALVEAREALEKANEAYRQAAQRLHDIEKEIDVQEARIRDCRTRIDESRERAGEAAGEADRLEARLARTVEQVRQHQEALSGSRDEVGRANEALAAAQGAADEVRQRVSREREELERLRARQFEAMNRAADCRNRLRAAEEALERNVAQRTRIEADRDSTSSLLNQLRSRAISQEQALDEQRRRTEDCRRSLREVEEALEAGRKEQTERTEALAAAREREQSAAARLATLEDVATRFAGVSDGVRALLGAPAAAGLGTRGVVADYIEAGAEIEGAAEGYLQSFLPTVILDDDEHLRRAARMLREEGAGRTSLVSRSHPAGGLAVGVSANGHGAIPEQVLDDPRVRGRLRDRIRLHTSVNGVLQDRVGDAVVVDDLEAALDLHRRYPSADYLTADGDVVYASGVVHAGGKPQGDGGLLAHKRRMDQSRAEYELAGRESGELQVRVERGREALSELERRRGELAQDVDAAAARMVELQMEAQRSADESERTGRRSAVLTDELANLVEAASSLEAQLVGIRQETGEVGEASDRLVAQVGTLAERLKLDEAEAAERGERASSLRAELAVARQRQAGLESEAARLAAEREELAGRIERSRSEAESAGRRAVEADALQKRTEEELAANLASRERFVKNVAEREREAGERQRALSENEADLRGSRAELESLRETTRDAELARARAESDREHLDDLCRQELGVSATEAAEHAAESMDGVDSAELQAEIDRIRDRLEKIGPVNMTAIEEYTELEERHTFLTAQRQDLDESMTKLRETIRRINRTSRERFLEAFEAIRAHYQEIFSLLFRGGRGDLRLEEGEDVLECGIDILAQPPGKRLASVNLMSGGEKALSAIALLFAVFRYQPSPFCLLDEVDAALDESNVGRFTRMLREYAEQTQFILVTHNKISMEAADVLYGVTMEEPGVSKLVSMQLH